MKRLLLLSLAPLLAFTASAAGATPAVLDGAALFGKPAVERASQVAADIQDKFGVQLVIETAKAPPGVDPDKLRRMRSKDQIRELREAARRRAEELNIHGLYALITTDPRHVTVVGWPADIELEWTTSSYKREELRRALAGHRREDPDDALVRAVEGYRAILGDPVRKSPLGTFRALAVVGALLGLWVLLSFLRSRAAAPERPLPIYPPAMLGSLFGVPAGFWVHDRLFQMERPASPEDAPAQPAPAPAPPAPGHAEPPAGEEAT